ISCGEDRNEFCGCCSDLYIWTAAGIFALDQAHGSDDFKTVFAGGFDGLDSGGSGGANIVDDHYPRAFFAEAFDAAAGAVLLLRFAHEEAIQIAAGYGTGYDDGIGAHGQSADGIGVPALFVDRIEEDLPDQLRAAGIERGGAAVDVIVAGSAGGQLEFTEAKGFASQQR